MTKLGPN